MTLTPAERTLAIQITTLGAVVILVVLVCKGFGVLRPLDNFIYDTRAKHFQYFSPRPTEQLVHLDMDEGALEVVGKWPWPRSQWAEILDELREAGAKVVAFDVFFAEREKPYFEPLETVSVDETTVSGRFRQRDDDLEFVEAVKRTPGVVLGVPLTIAGSDDVANKDRPVYEVMLEAFRNDPGIEDAQVVQLVMEKQKLSQEEAESYRDQFLASARRRAMFEAIQPQLELHGTGRERIREHLLKNVPTLRRTLVDRVFDQQYERAVAARAMERFSRAPIDGLPRLINPRDEAANLPELSYAAAGSGFVDDYLRFEDGIIRAIPLWVDHRDRLFPQLGLAMACQMLEISPGDVELRANAVILPVKGKLKERRVIPVRVRQSSRYGEIGMILDIPWFGPRQWEQMYDFDRKRETRQHYSLTDPWKVHQTRLKAERSSGGTDLAILDLLDEGDGRFSMDTAKAAAYKAALPKETDFDARAAMCREGLKVLSDSQYIEEFQKITEPSDKEKDQLRVLTLIRDTLRNYVNLIDQFGLEQSTLSERVKDKAVLIGWTALGKVDFLQTPIHSAAPGSVVHGVVFNAIMIGDFWRHAPPWVSYAMIIVIGAMATVLTSVLPPWQSMAVTLLLVIVPGAIDALFVFDLGNIILDAAGPAIVAPAVWSILTVVRFIVERAERDRITSRFRSYVDPILVEYVLENPDRARLEGQEKELTVVFTDLGGFTTLTEHLGKGTVPILNDYMSLMVPIIRRHGGYVNKFLGDGIMFFFGAPKHSDTHAIQAVDAVMEMQAAMETFNRQMRDRELPALSMRAGINTGEMIVGDAGPEDGSDYTVLGDAVNLAARLESANKQTGTLVMIGQRTAELINGRYLLVPLGRIRVKGKETGVMTYSPVARTEEATDDQRRRGELHLQLVELFRSGRFADCLELIEKIEEEIGPSKVTRLYRAQCEQEKSDAFDGTIVLTEK